MLFMSRMRKPAEDPLDRPADFEPFLVNNSHRVASVSSSGNNIQLTILEKLALKARQLAAG